MTSTEEKRETYQEQLIRLRSENDLLKMSVMAIRDLAETGGEYALRHIEEGAERILQEVK